MITVETTGNFMLMDPHNGQVIEHEGTSDVVRTNFIDTCLADKRLTLIKGEPEPVKAAPKKSGLVAPKE